MDKMTKWEMAYMLMNNGVKFYRKNKRGKLEREWNVRAVERKYKWGELDRMIQVYICDAYYDDRYIEEV